MKPLLFMRFYRHHKKRLLLLAIPVMLCTMAVFLIQSLISSYVNAQDRAFVQTRKAYTGISARGNPIDPGMLEAIRQHEDTQKVVPCVQVYTEMAGMLDQVGVRVYLMRQGDLAELMARMNVTLAEGRLPHPDENEIVLHRAVAANKGLSIGDTFGNDKDPLERLLGLYKVVGLAEGVPLCGFAPLESWQAGNGISMPQEYGVLVYAKDGRLHELNRYLQYLPLTGNELTSYLTSVADLSASMGRISGILNIVYIALLLVISLCVGFLTYLFTMGRAREFAILNIIGFSKREILRRSLLEIGAINLIACAAAVLCSMGICFALNATVFDPMGIPMKLFDWQTMVICLCVPLISVIAETMAVASAFGSKDAIGILESEN